ncbi:MAG TPA: TlpA disulfide reductase family protein [Chitinophagaceae bacterium]|nr:TlpA disulfide reductase family protein [Chitinophagaceae bacterium]
MKRIIEILLALFFSGYCFAQNSFNECRDSIQWHFNNDTAFDFGNNISKWQNCIQGKQMPELSLETITGEKIETKDLKGKVIVINLWFTTCQPCIAELPALNRLVEEYKKKNVVFLGISTDTKTILDTDFFPKYKFDFKIIADGDVICKKIGRTGFPTIYIIDRTGKVKDAWIGGLSANDKTAETAVYLKAKPIIDELLKAE